MYSNPPPEVDACKTMLLASATFTAMASSSNIHYPSVALGDSESPDALPVFLIEPLEDAPKVLAPGVVAPGGKIQILLYMVSSTGSDIEKKARAIKDEMGMVLTGLPIISMQVGMASEPDGGFRASQSYQDAQATGVVAAVRTIPIIINYGITG